MLKKLFLINIMIINSLILIAQQNGKLSGTIIDQSFQKPLLGVSIKVMPGNYNSISDSLGQFRITGINPGSYYVSITMVGYQPKSLLNFIISSGNEANIQVELEQSVVQLANITVSPRKNSVKVATIESPLSVQRLTTEDIKANPGGNFDISKVIQSLPGVGGGAGGGSYRNDIIIRGGAPQ